MALTSPDAFAPPRELRMLSREVNREGKLKKETYYRFVYDDAAKDFVLVEAFEGNKEVTEKARRENQRREERQGDGDSDTYVHSIFDPELADGLILKPRDAVEIVAGRDCRAYDYTIDVEWPMGPNRTMDVTEAGVVWLDMETGAPLRLESGAVDAPAAVKEYSYHFEATVDEAGTWRPLKLRVDFAGSFLFVYMAGGFSLTYVYES